MNDPIIALKSGAKTKKRRNKSWPGVDKGSAEHGVRVLADRLRTRLNFSSENLSVADPAYVAWMDLMDKPQLVKRPQSIDSPRQAIDFYDHLDSDAMHEKCIQDNLEFNSQMRRRMGLSEQRKRAEAESMKAITHQAEVTAKNTAALEGK